MRVHGRHPWPESIDELPAGNGPFAPTATTFPQPNRNAIFYQDLILVTPPEGSWSHIAPPDSQFRYRCAGRKGVFHNFHHDQSSKIAAVVTVQGESTPPHPDNFHFKFVRLHCGRWSAQFESESSCSIRSAEFFGIVDPDVVIGYNIANSISLILLDRATAIKATKFPRSYRFFPD